MEKSEEIQNKIYLATGLLLERLAEEYDSRIAAASLLLIEAKEMLENKTKTTKNKKEK